MNISVKNLESIYFRHCLSIFWAFLWQHFTWATPSFSIPFDARQGDVEKAAEKLSQADRCNSDSRGEKGPRAIPLNYPVGWYAYKTCMIIYLNSFKMKNIRVLRIIIYIHVIYIHIYIYMCVYAFVYVYITWSCSISRSGSSAHVAWSPVNSCISWGL